MSTTKTGAQQGRSMPCKFALFIVHHCLKKTLNPKSICHTCIDDKFNCTNWGTGWKAVKAPQIQISLNRGISAVWVKASPIKVKFGTAYSCMISEEDAYYTGGVLKSSKFVQNGVFWQFRATAETVY